LGGWIKLRQIEVLPEIEAVAVVKLGGPEDAAVEEVERYQAE